MGGGGSIQDMNNRISGNRNLVKTNSLFQTRKGESRSKVNRRFTFHNPSKKQLAIIKRANRIYKRRFRLKLALSLAIAFCIFGLLYWVIIIRIIS